LEETLAVSKEKREQVSWLTGRFMRNDAIVRFQESSLLTLKDETKRILLLV